MCRCGDGPVGEGWMRFVTSALASSLILVGCATHTQRDANELRAVIQTAAASGKSCLSDVAAKHPDLAAHMPLQGAEPTFRQLADKRLITPEDARSLLSWHSDLEHCREIVAATLMPALPSMAETMKVNDARIDAAYFALLRRQISWGDANWRLQTARHQGREAIAADVRAVDQQSRQEDAAER